MNEDDLDLKQLAAEREKEIVKTSGVGIAANVLLAAFKTAAGIAAHSIAIVLDAVNNLSDALSSVITIVGAKLAGKAPDKKHPLGYGRVEYLSSLLVASIVLYAGLTALVESVKKIVHPVQPEYAPLTLAILAVGIVVKLVLGRWVKKQGEKVNSGALVASGADASFDALLSASVLAAAVVQIIWGVSLEAWLGAGISAVIIKSGVEMLTGTLDDILGVRSDAELNRQIVALLAEEPEVFGAYDLFLYNFGPNKNYGSVHLELADTMTAEEIDRLTRRLETKVYRKTGVLLTGVGVYSRNTGDGEAAQIENAMRTMALSHEWVLQFHGFHADTEHKIIRFDVVLSFDIDRHEAVATLLKEAQAIRPDYAFQIAPDVDVSDV